MPTPVRMKPNTGILDGQGDSLFKQRLTLVHPFFGEEERFKLQYQNWQKFSDEVKDALDIVVVDDYGTPAIADLLTPNYNKHCDFNLSIYRIDEDLKYNTPGALNLGALAAKTDWILIMDSDCLFDPKTMEELLSLHPKAGWDYKFERNRITKDSHWAKNTRYLPCTILFHKDMFMDIHGFDEDFTGTRSGGYAFFDNHFDHKALEAGYHCGIVPDLIATEYMDDFVGERIARSKQDESVNKALAYRKYDGTAPPNNELVRFPWTLAYNHRR